MVSGRRELIWPPAPGGSSRKRESGAAAPSDSGAARRHTAERYSVQSKAQARDAASQLERV